MARLQSYTVLLLLLVVAYGDAGGSRARSKKRQSARKPELVTIKSAKTVTYDFGNKTLEQELCDSGKYNPKAVLVYDVQADSSRNRMFLTTPLVAHGIPASLGTAPIDNNSSDLILRPYPNLELQHTTLEDITDCKTQIVSTVAIAKTWTDPDTLYALDTGILDSSFSRKRVCPPKILAFDLRTDKLINATEITNDHCMSLYLELEVESCPDGGLVAYSADSWGFLLTVTDLTTGISRHLKSRYFYPKPEFGFSSIGGEPYFYIYGLLGLAIDESCSGKLYAQPYSSDLQGVLDKEAIRNASDGQILDLTMEVVVPGLRSGTGGVTAVDASGHRLFFTMCDDSAVYCWDTRKPYSTENFIQIAQDDVTLQYIGALKVEAETDRLWVVSDRYNQYIVKKTNYSEDNYRIFYMDLRILVC